jgi:hypothetical protein
LTACVVYAIVGAEVSLGNEIREER